MSTKYEIKELIHNAMDICNINYSTFRGNSLSYIQVEDNHSFTVMTDETRLNLNVQNRFFDVLKDHIFKVFKSKLDRHTMAISYNLRTEKLQIHLNIHY